MKELQLVYGYAQRFAEIGIADALHERFSSPSLALENISLKVVALNDEICRLLLIVVALIPFFSFLLSKLVGSDVKIAIILNGRLDRPILLSNDIEMIIVQAKESHATCKDVITAGSALSA